LVSLLVSCAARQPIKPEEKYVGPGKTDEQRLRDYKECYYEGTKSVPMAPMAYGWGSAFATQAQFDSVVQQCMELRGYENVLRKGR
jgi:hypothetical protein